MMMNNPSKILAAIAVALFSSSDLFETSNFAHAIKMDNGPEVTENPNFYSFDGSKFVHAWLNREVTQDSDPELFRQCMQVYQNAELRRQCPELRIQNSEGRRWSRRSRNLATQQRVIMWTLSKVRNAWKITLLHSTLRHRQRQRSARLLILIRFLTP